ncbi:hypothetical protein [uncultured Alsobacter sp.]|uniref:hypothetical protein n=1 Tax=uncultured Alsobacter sp. TaxID=1748258 RepID=UPI002600D7C4|nr:hypothetical protein [uncultured Alsobacter sp.]
MPIYTSSWFQKLPPGYIRVGVSRGIPRGIGSGFKMYRTLAPGDWFKSVDVEEYRRRYFQGLDQLNPRQVVAEIAEVARGWTPVLCCYEAPRDRANWCHRGYISAWLKDQLDMDVFEVGLEKDGAGWAHPKLPREHRREPPGLFDPINVETWKGRTWENPFNGEVWTVIGQDPDNPDQAVVACGEQRRSVSQAVLEKKFGAATGS